MSKSENCQPEKAAPGSIPPIIVQPLERPYVHVCVLPAKPKNATAPARSKPAETPPKPNPEPTLEKRIADEVERRLKERSGNFLLGFIIGELYWASGGTSTIETEEAQ